MESSFRFRNAFRFRYVLWLDKVKAKQTALNLSCRPDLLLCNSLKEEKGRILVEFENSLISDLGLLDKINHLTHRPADWILFLASSQSLLENLGRLVRKILRGECKSNRQTVFFTSTAQGCVYRNILFGLWSPFICFR